MATPVMHLEDHLKLDFKPNNLRVPLYAHEVQGYEATVEPTQEDVDAVAATLTELYHAMPPGQQAVVSYLMVQAAQAGS